LRYSNSRSITGFQAFFRSANDLIQGHAHHPLLGGRELAPFDLGVIAAVPPEEIVHQDEHQLGIHHEQRGAPQRLDLDHIQAGGHEQGVHVFGELAHLHAAHGDLGGAAQQVEQADAQVPRKTLVDHLQRGHAPAHDPVLAGEVVPPGYAVVGLQLGLGVHIAAVHPVQQGIDLFLGKRSALGHGAYCITKEVK
jgi:hypothetical protein